MLPMVGAFTSSQSLMITDLVQEHTHALAFRKHSQSGRRTCREPSAATAWYGARMVSVRRSVDVGSGLGHGGAFSRFETSQRLYSSWATAVTAAGCVRASRLTCTWPLPAGEAHAAGGRHQRRRAHLKGGIRPHADGVAGAGQPGPVRRPRVHEQLVMHVREGRRPVSVALVSGQPYS